MDWLEPTSDNEWEPSALPSTINFKRIKLDQNTCEDTENEPFIDISSDSEVHSFGRFQDSPQEPHFPDEPFIDISSCETLNSPQEPHFPDEPFVDISSGDEVLIQPLPNIADEPVVEIESADEYNPQFLHNYNYINGDDVIHEKEQTGEPKEDEEEEGEEEEDDEAGYADVEVNKYYFHYVSTMFNFSAISMSN